MPTTPKPYDVRLRRYTPGGGAAPILQTTTLDWTAPRSDVPTLTFTAAEAVTGVLPGFLEVAVELWNGATWNEPRNGRFFVLKRSGDGLDATGTLNYTGVALASYMLSKALVVTADGADLECGSNVGRTVGGVFRDAQARGWGTHLGASFTDTHDSAGALWDVKQAGLAGLTFKPGTTLKAVLQTLADQYIVEYAFNGRTLELYNPGTGDDLSEGTGRVTVGQGAKELPVTTTLEDLATHVTIRGEEGSAWTYPILGASEAMGRLELSIDSGGVTTDTQAAQIAELYQVTGSAPRHQYTVTEPAAAMAARPFVEYKTGDWVAARRPTGWERMRVVQVQIRKDADASIEVDVILEDIMTDLAARIARRIAGRVGGSGTAPASSYSGGGMGGGSGGKRGTLATPWGDDASGARVIFEGSTEPDGIRYRWSDGYSPVSADPVFMVPVGDDNELIIVHRLKGVYIPTEGYFQGKFLHRALDPLADNDPGRVGYFATVLPDDMGEASMGLTLNSYGEATITENGTWDFEYKVTLDAGTPTDPGTDWPRSWAALSIMVTSPGDQSMGDTEIYHGPHRPAENTAQTFRMYDNGFGSPVTLSIRDRRSFSAGQRVQAIVNTPGLAANVNQDASFLKITRIA